MSISKRAKEIQNHFQWNNVELGEAAGVSKAAVGNWINYDMPPGRDALIQLRKRHNINDEWFLSGKGEMFISISSNDIDETIDNLSGLSLAEQKEVEEFIDYLLWKRKAE